MTWSNNYFYYAYYTHHCNSGSMSIITTIIPTFKILWYSILVYFVAYCVQLFNCLRLGDLLREKIIKQYMHSNSLLIQYTF